MTVNKEEIEFALEHLKTIRKDKDFSFDQQRALRILSTNMHVQMHFYDMLTKNIEEKSVVHFGQTINLQDNNKVKLLHEFIQVFNTLMLFSTPVNNGKGSNMNSIRGFFHIKGRLPVLEDDITICTQGGHFNEERQPYIFSPKGRNIHKITVQGLNFITPDPGETFRHVNL